MAGSSASNVRGGWSLRHPCLIGLALLMALPAAAQDSTVVAPGTLALMTASTALQTGQYYDVTIAFEVVPEVWLVSAEIVYDADMLYVYGTKSQSAPVTPGSFFDTTLSVVIRNLVFDEKIRYLISLVAPAEVAKGSGVVGTFRIFPLASGTTTLSLVNVEAASVQFARSGDQLSASNPSPVTLTTRDLTLTITGEQVTPPPEPSPTPYTPPSPTPFATIDSTEAAAYELQITLTAAALATGVPAATTVVVYSDASPVLIIALVLIVLAAFGGGMLLALYITRSKRR
jgi:hypothetical protein